MESMAKARSHLRCKFVVFDYRRDRRLTQVTDAMMFKLQVHHQHIHPKRWLPWAFVPSGLKPTTQDPGLKCGFMNRFSMNRFSEACPICLRYFPMKTFQTLTKNICTTCSFWLQYLVRFGPVPGWLQLCLAQSMPPVLAVLLIRGQKASLKIQGHK